MMKAAALQLERLIENTKLASKAGPKLVERGGRVSWIIVLSSFASDPVPIDTIGFDDQLCPHENPSPVTRHQVVSMFRDHRLFLPR